MENASKALIMAGGVLIGVLVISLAVYLFVSFGQTSAEINDENSQKQLTQFNSKFTSYEGKKNLTIYDAITVAGYANENNKYYDNDSNYIIIVNLDGKRIDNNLKITTRYVIRRNAITYSVSENNDNVIYNIQYFLPTKTYSCLIGTCKNNKNEINHILSIYNEIMSIL